MEMNPPKSNVGPGGGRSSKVTGDGGESKVDKPCVTDVLADGFPGRRNEIEELMSIVGGPCDSFPPVLVYGGASTGKTSVVREMFSQLKRPHAYASCRSCHTPRILLESLLNSLVSHVRTAETNYGSYRKCERAADFVQLLPDACQQAVRRMNKYPCSSADEQLLNMFGNLDWFKAEAWVVYLIIDNVEVIRDWSGGSTLLSVLFRLPELARLPQLGVVLISNVGPHAYMSGTGSREPLAVYFRDYLDGELLQIILRKHRNSDLYRPFLEAVLKPFTRVTRRVTELSGILEPLFDKYSEPVASGAVRLDAEGKRKLFTLIKPHVKKFMERPSSILTASPGGQTVQEDVPSPGPTTNRGQLLEDQVSQLHLPLCSKYLLLSAYIASTNPATLDSALFEAGGGNTSRKRKRRSSLSATERKERELQERQLKGPGSFSLERLLAIFSCIATSSPGLNANNRSFQQMSDAENVEVTADVLMQISTLVGVNLISQGLTDPLEGSPKFRCNLSEELVQKVAKSVNFPLSKYLYYNY